MSNTIIEEKPDLTNQRNQRDSREVLIAIRNYGVRNRARQGMRTLEELEEAVLSYQNRLRKVIEKKTAGVIGD